MGKSTSSLDDLSRGTQDGAHDPVQRKTTSAGHDVETQNAKSQCCEPKQEINFCIYFFYCFVWQKAGLDHITWFLSPQWAVSDISAFYEFVYVLLLFQLIKHNSKNHIILISNTAAWTAAHYLSPQTLSLMYSNKTALKYPPTKEKKKQNSWLINPTAAEKLMTGWAPELMC